MTTTLVAAICDKSVAPGRVVPSTTPVGPRVRQRARVSSLGRKVKGKAKAKAKARARVRARARARVTERAKVMVRVKETERERERRTMEARATRRLVHRNNRWARRRLWRLSCRWRR
jgi:hypothetical protein